MCAACEMGFWMAMDEPPPVAVVPKRKGAQAVDGFACDAPEVEAVKVAKVDKPAPRRKAASSEPRRRAANSPSKRERKS